jgi:hypothetical protein
VVNRPWAVPSEEARRGPGCDVGLPVLRRVERPIARHRIVGADEGPRRARPCFVGHVPRNAPRKTAPGRHGVQPGRVREHARVSRRGDIASSARSARSAGASTSRRGSRAFRAARACGRTER